MSAEKYAEYVFLDYVLGSEFDEVVTGRWIPLDEMKFHFQNAVYKAFKVHGYEVPNRYIDIADRHFDQLLELDLISVDGDEFIGNYGYITVADKDNYTSDNLARSEIFERLERLGHQALARALKSLSVSEKWNEPDSSESSATVGSVSTAYVEVPAADRIVRLDDNQRNQLESATTDIIDGVELENAIDGDPVFRDQVIGQMKAARELFRVGTLRAYLAYEALFKVLGTLIDKYGGKAIGQTSQKLLDLLIEHIFGK